MKEREMEELLDAWEKAFWNYRNDVGIGDSYSIESERLMKNLAKLRGDLEQGKPSTLLQIRSFLNDYGELTPGIEEIIIQAERGLGVAHAKSYLDYSEYLEY